MRDQAGRTRVLIVDDKQEILELLGEYLRARDYDVVTATDGRDALEVVRSGTVDLVLTDMKMPQMDGLQLLDEIRQVPHPVATIIMTGFATVDSAIRAMKQGAFDYLPKPFKLREVYAALVRASERLRLERQSQRAHALLDFYERCHRSRSSADIPALCRQAVDIASAETEASSAAVWSLRDGAWREELRVGEALDGFDPSGVAEPAIVEGGLAVVPLETGGTRGGALAVGGGADRGSAHLERLTVLARALSEVLTRAGWPGA